MVQCQTFSNALNDDEDNKRSNKNNNSNNKNDDNDDTLDKKAVESIIYETGTCLMQCH